MEDIDHTRTRTKRPQTNGICERFHKTVLNEFYRTAFRKTIYRTVGPCSRTWTRGSSPTIRAGRTKDGGATADAAATFLDTVPLAKEKLSA